MNETDLSVSIANEIPSLHLTHRFPAGRTTAVVGPNGAGKTTMLRMIAGLLVGDSGTRITLGDNVFRDDRTSLPPHRRPVALLSQEARLFPHLSVASNIAFAPSAQRLPRAEVRDRVRRWMAATEVTDLADRKPDQLSGGQAQRVAIARAFAAEPRILLLDEPFRALDVDVASRLRGLLRTLLADHERTTIMVTHDVLDAVGLADEIVVLDGGRLVESGSTRAVLAGPTSRFAASLSGLNLFLGTMDTSGGVMDADGNRVVGMAAETLDPGTAAAAAFSPRAVAVYLQAPQGSPRTTLRGVIRELEPRGDHALLNADVEDQTVAAEVTWAAVADLGLEIGLDVDLVVKANEVKIYGAASPVSSDH
ncbi:ATP-binding cassette domain-containing protein [Gordonia sp. ABSL49_1]|uniref:sulfate/molybdate ABC transporter ATP-binding protein n=1 Tax=unclassified Gordonia (in: high G+C Gram-positive bacteria) TaxID=2657482 RepID=UPI001F109C0D|nr:ATP-binding cassette domain-containing protein [Gordonia sp. ABSL49_1]MCH5641044.1 ATP-binding cassette domain-containing protein [Gordonia sp. ABSL49_1]